MVNVWATWCGPCRQEQPGLVRTAKRYADRGVRFVGLNYQDNRAAAQAWVEEYQVPYESLFDEMGSYADDLGFPYLPDTYIVDAGGTIRWAIYGETSEAEVSELIDDVLARAAPADRRLTGRDDPVRGARRARPRRRARPGTRSST